MKSDKGQMLEPDSAEPQKQTGGNRKGKHDPVRFSQTIHMSPE